MLATRARSSIGQTESSTRVGHQSANGMFAAVFCVGAIATEIWRTACNVHVSCCFTSPRYERPKSRGLRNTACTAAFSNADRSRLDPDLRRRGARSGGTHRTARRSVRVDADRVLAPHRYGRFESVSTLQHERATSSSGPPNAALTSVT